MKSEIIVKEHDLSKSSPQSLAGMMDLGEPSHEPWGPEELAAILSHQLSAPVEFDFTYLGAEASQCARTLSPAKGPPVRSFNDLLHHTDPPVELLEWTKQFAKDCRKRPDGPLPDEIATVLYYLSIVAAMTKCRRRISRLDDSSLRYALEWALDQPWLDEPSRELFGEGCLFIDAAEPKSDV